MTKKKKKNVVRLWIFLWANCVEACDQRNKRKEERGERREGKEEKRGENGKGDIRGHLVLINLQ